MNRAAPAVFAALSLCIASLSVPTAFAEPPQQIDVQKLTKEAGVVDNVVVPLPSEIFAVLDKLDRVAWVEVLRPVKEIGRPRPGREHTALLLGTVIAEGFIAVEAENAAEVKNIGNSVLALAKSIGVEKAVVRRANAIIEMADKRDWQQVRRELDGALRDVKVAMAEIRDEHLANLVSLGGWLRGTEALTQVVNRNYKKDSAELLHQPVLVQHFEKKLTELPQKMQKELVMKMRDGLIKIRPLMGHGDETAISEKSVKEIGEISADLMKAVQQKGSDRP